MNHPQAPSEVIALGLSLVSLVVRVLFEMSETFLAPTRLSLEELQRVALHCLSRPVLYYALVFQGALIYLLVAGLRMAAGGLATTGNFTKGSLAQGDLDD